MRLGWSVCSSALSFLQTLPLNQLLSIPPLVTVSLHLRHYNSHTHTSKREADRRIAFNSIRLLSSWVFWFSGDSTIQSVSLSHTGNAAEGRAFAVTLQLFIMFIMNDLSTFTSWFFLQCIPVMSQWHHSVRVYAGKKQRCVDSGATFVSANLWDAQKPPERSVHTCTQKLVQKLNDW